MINNLSKMRCLKNFTPLKIFNLQKNGKPSSMYKIVKKENQTIGSFMFSDDGHLSSLEIDQQYRRKKTGVNALLTLYNFVMEKAREKNIDCIHFLGLKNNPNNVVRLYKKIAYIFPELSNSNLFLLPTNSNGEKMCVQFMMPIEVSKKDVENIVTAIKQLNKTV